MEEQVSVITVYDAKKRSVRPYKLLWQNREYKITKIGYYHAVRRGKTILHMYYVTSNNLDFALECNGDNLHWSLKEVVDGSAL